MQYRQMQFSEIEAGLSFCRAANWNQLRRDWELLLELSPDGCRIALHENQIVGTVTAVRYGGRFGWIGMMLVSPTLRRQGIGRQLMQQAIDLLQSEDTVKLDATPVGRELYLTLDFIDEYRLSRMATTVSGAGLMSSSARLMMADDLPKLRAMDYENFGADRYQLLEWIRSDAPEYAWVVDGADGVRGYCLGRHGHDYEHLGPVIATDCETAQQLVSACLREHIGKPFLLDASLWDEEWLQWLTAIGFAKQRPFYRMYRGTNRFPGKPENQFAILGPEFG